ncbi:FKBP-type peptidyl-prolyl cis-trans isomerase (trigger factor) [Bradyrhizobium sp. LM6.11]
MDAMQVTETLSEGLKHEFKISVPASDLDAKAGAKLVDLKDKVKINGFRPGNGAGHAPQEGLWPLGDG